MKWVEVAGNFKEKNAPLYTWKIPSKHNKGKYYSVEWRDNGKLTCDCPAFTMSGKKKTCKHIQILNLHYNA